MQNSNFNLGSLIDPSITTDQLTLARQQAMAAMLQQQGATPIDANRPYHISPLEGVAKLAQVLAAGRMNQSNDKSQAALSQKSMNAMAQMLGGSASNLFGTAQPSQPQEPQMVPDREIESQGGNAYAPAPQQASPQQGQQPNNRFGLANLLRGSAIGQFGGDSAEKAFYADQARTEAAKRDAELGLTPQEQASAVRAENSIKGMINVRPGGSLAGAGPDGSPRTLYIAPDTHRGATFSVNPDGSVKANEIGNLAAINQKMAESTALGEAAGKPFAGFTASGQPAPITSIASVLNQPQGSPAGIPPEVMAAANAGRNFHMTMTPDGTVQNQPLSNQSQPPRGGQVYGSQPLGAASNADTAATAAQTELSKKWMALNDQNREAQNTTSYLQNIKDLASKAATGPQSDKLNFVNGLLSLAGQERATDSVTANFLMEKYSKQITSRLGQGGLGTDAARSILESAYPNSKMNVPAIHEAVDNLVGANEMVKAKTRLLGPSGDARNPVDYAQKERAFDQAADPRVFQLQNMSPQAQVEYVKRLPPDVAKQILQQRQSLKQLGVFQ